MAANINSKTPMEKLTMLEVKNNYTNQLYYAEKLAS